MSILSDLRFALRQWRKNRLATVAAIVTLALGTGVNTAIFSVIHSVMIKPLPYPHPDRLVQVWSTDLNVPSDPNRMSSSVRQITPLPIVERWRESSRLFEDFGGYRPWMVNLIVPRAEPERVRTARVTPGFFRVLGSPAVKGRLFAPDEDKAGRDRVVILSDAAWRARFAGDPAALGSTVSIDGAPFTIIGILPPGFESLVASIGDQPEVYQPLTREGGRFERIRWAFVVGRLRPGATMRDASAELAGFVQSMGAADPRTGAHGVRIAPLSEEIAGELKPALMILFAATSLVLLIACANLANLMLASTAARQREIGLRVALGASRTRIVGQVLTESMALSIAGSLCGLALSFWGVEGVVRLYPQAIPRMNAFHTEPAVFLFAAAIAAITAWLFGALPALRYSRPEIQQVLKESGQSATRRRGHRGDLSGGALVAGQVAMALVLLIGAGLLMRSFVVMRAIAPGFSRHNLLIAHMTLDDKAYHQPSQQAEFTHRLLERLQSIPGVESAAVTNSLPLDFNLLLSTTFLIESRPELGQVYEDTKTASADYFRTLGITLLQGRYLDASDAARDNAVVVNYTFARNYFGDANPIGRRLKFSEKTTRTIVGVVADIKNRKLERPTAPELYLPFDNLPTSFVDVAVRSSADPRVLTGGVREALRAVDPNQPLGTVKTMDAVLEDSVAKPRWYGTLVGSFAALALLLSATGIYGVVAYSVNRRTTEIGIRMAIGAAKSDVLRMVIRESMIPALCGVIAGIPAAIAASRVLTAYLYGVELLDPRTYLGVALLVPAITLAAAYLPARRATTVDPLVALRHE